MRRTLAGSALLLTLLACGTEDHSTQPTDPAASTQSLAAARNTWTPVASRPYAPEFFGYLFGAAPNRSGQWVVYSFGGTDGEGGSGFGVSAYNVSTNTWSGRSSRAIGFQMNGVSKLGSRLYFSGGWDFGTGSKAALKALWAYDFVQDRMIRRADIPIFSAEGVSGVIDGKLYVLPGACSGDLWPTPGYCEVERTRRFFVYDPATNGWSTRAQSPHFHRQGASAVIDGKLYVVGGFRGVGGNGPVRDLDVYDPATDSWQSLAPIPIGGLATGATLAGRFFVVVHTFQGTTSVIRAFAYNPGTNTWAARAAPDFFGPVVRVTKDGQARLFTAAGDRSALYTP
jgi:hypothetical protein